MFENQPVLAPTNYWSLFTGLSFVTAAGMMAGGIYFLEASFAAKGFYAMSAIMLVHTSITLTKTFRDIEESRRLVNRIDDARTEKLLMETGQRDVI
ncbi:YiaA/YiaB family inner membrane protein [uncultured Hoeflea sp.]|uniref:YiaA/YiaB family inner membrane protein n=1 Tax=uncultured Hoeflea sp. TaxID=538666 RepID=UPI0026025FED|nr:YiaA/YiaB family inner membrane protein [uncultured Hoeflea sp.]